MWRQVTVVVVGVFLLGTASVAGQYMGDDHLVPVVARTQGGGQPPTYWVTDVVIHNVNPYPKTIGLAFFPFDQANDFDCTNGCDYPVILSLEARETWLVEDVLGTLFQATGNTKGALLVSASAEDFPENRPPSGMLNLILVTTRTYNTGDPAGTYGQTIAPNMMVLNGSGEQGGVPMASYITGARHGGRYRSNLGIVSIADEEVRVHFQVRDPQGSPFVGGYKDIPKLSGGQWSFSDLGVPQSELAYSVELWLDQSDVTPNPCQSDWTNYFAAYVSKVDGNPDGTGDAEFIWAVPTEMPPVGFICP